MALTGLERPIVFQLMLEKLKPEEVHTRQIYVGLTCALERLVIQAGNPRLWAGVSGHAIRATHNGYYRELPIMIRQGRASGVTRNL